MSGTRRCSKCADSVVDVGIVERLPARRGRAEKGGPAEPLRELVQRGPRGAVRLLLAAGVTVGSVRRPAPRGAWFRFADDRVAVFEAWCETNPQALADGPRAQIGGVGSWHGGSGRVHCRARAHGPGDVPFRSSAPRAVRRRVDSARALTQARVLCPIAAGAFIGTGLRRGRSGGDH